MLGSNFLSFFREDIFISGAQNRGFTIYIARPIVSPVKPYERYIEAHGWGWIFPIVKWRESRWTKLLGIPSCRTHKSIPWKSLLPPFKQWWWTFWMMINLTIKNGETGKLTYRKWWPVGLSGNNTQITQTNILPPPISAEVKGVFVLRVFFSGESKCRTSLSVALDIPRMLHGIGSFTDIYHRFERQM